MENEEPIKPSPMNKTQLAQLYNVGDRTFSKWIEPFEEEIGEYRGRCYTPIQVTRIFELIGMP